MAIITSNRICTLVSVLWLVTSSGSTTYNGGDIGSFGSTQYSVAGTVYAVDSNTIRIIGFTYNTDGSAPDAVLWAGESGSAPSGSGFIIPNEFGSTSALPAYSGKDIEVHLPSGMTVSSLNWISVWSMQNSMSFGHVTVPPGFTAPAEYNLGEMGFSPRVHNVHASAVIVLNAKQIRFENLDYDGTGPAAYFWVGPGGTPKNGNGHRRIPDENGRTNPRPSSYNDATITITLQDEDEWFDFGYVGLWCITFNQDFGHVDINPSQLNVPPAPLPTPLLPNCETLINGHVQVSWMIDQADIVFQISSTNSRGDYVAFGVSGSDTSSTMIGGDVAVSFIDSNNEPQAIDYYLSSQAQCSPQTNQGACPDTLASDQSTDQSADHVTLIGSVIDNGITSITYRRPLAAQDATYDKEIPTDRSIYVIWARGRINDDGRVSYHSQRTEGNLQINFGRSGSTCPRLSVGGDDGTTQPAVDGWKIPGIKSLENTTFEVQMGLAGGRRGYDAITGRPGWGIAYFINESLIPEITVQRGQTYTFLVRSGNNPNTSANYHPFYITNDASGGYAQLMDEERMGIEIYAGPVEGPLCQWDTTASTRPAEEYTKFADYRQTLTVNCQPGEPAELVWTVAEDTPKLVYYHCYTHRFLGWKIHVSGASSVTFSGLVLASLYLLYLAL